MALDERIYNEQSGFFEPYRESGENALAAYNYEMGMGSRPSDYSGFQETPGFQFQMNQGQQAIDGSAAARGQVFSGATLKAQQQFGQGLANQEYGNYLNRLSGMAGAGQAAAGQQATAAGNMGVSSGNALASIGNAQAAGAIGMGNAVMGGINNLVGLNAYQQANNAPQYGAPTTSPRPVLRSF